MYDVINSWLATNVVYDSYNSFVDSLPIISFSLSTPTSNEGYNTFYIPLANLILNSEALEDSTTAPKFTVKNSNGNETYYIIGIIRGYDIVSSADSYSTPNIIFGTLVLQTIYFTANMNTGSIGLANKYLVGAATSTPSSMVPYAPYVTYQQLNQLINNGGQCRAATNCYVGDSTSELDYATNTCTTPDCRNYFYNEVNPNNPMTCVVKMNYYSAGVTLLVICVFLDIFSYIAGQYTGYTSCQVSNVDESERYYGAYAWPLRSARQYVENLEKTLILRIGPIVVKCIDFTLVHIIHWVTVDSSRLSHRSNANTGNPSRQYPAMNTEVPLQAI